VRLIEGNAGGHGQMHKNAGQQNSARIAHQKILGRDNNIESGETRKKRRRLPKQNYGQERRFCKF
jgi:hypothetical protein